MLYGIMIPHSSSTPDGWERSVSRNPQFGLSTVVSYLEEDPGTSFHPSATRLRFDVIPKTDLPDITGKRRAQLITYLRGKFILSF
jgi:hypothetical protein